MKKHLVALLMIFVLLGAAANLSAQGISGALRVQDGSGGALLRVTHYGGLLVTIFNDMEYAGVDRSTTVSHVGSTVHMAGIIRGFGPQGTNVVDAGNLALQVNCVVGCGSGGTQAHITSVTHVVGSVQLISQAGAVATFTSTSLNVNCTGGCAGGSSDAVNVFHQSTVRHVSSVTHVAGGVSLVGRDGTYVSMTGTSLDVNCTGCSAASVTAISHISAMVHTTGVVVGFGKQNTDVVDVANASLKVSQGPARWPISHVTSVTHVTLGISTRMQVFQVTNCGSTAARIISSNPSRKSLRLRNVGTLPIWIQGGHVTVTSSNGWTIHAVTTVANTTETSVVELPDFQGQIDCISTGPVKVEVMEILR